MMRMEETKAERQKLAWEREERLRQQRLEKHKIDTSPQYRKMNEHYIDKNNEYVVTDSYIEGQCDILF